MVAVESVVLTDAGKNAGKNGGKQSKGRSSGGTKGFRAWHSKAVPKPRQLGANEAANSQEITTMMLRNIPNKYMQSNLLQEIDSLGFEGTYDFFYLPMDMHNRSNVGYCFINFLSSVDATRFEENFTSHRFRQFSSRKTGVVSVAHVQGLAANVRHFENRAITHSSEEQYRPVVLKGRRRVTMKEALSDIPAGQKNQETAPPPGMEPIAKNMNMTVMPEIPFSRDSLGNLSMASTEISSAGSPASEAGSTTPTMSIGGFDLMRPVDDFGGARLKLEELVCQAFQTQLAHGSSVTGSPPLTGKTPYANLDLGPVDTPTNNIHFDVLNTQPVNPYLRLQKPAGADELYGLMSKLKDRLDGPCQQPGSNSALPSPMQKASGSVSAFSYPPGLEPSATTNPTAFDLAACAAW